MINLSGTSSWYKLEMKTYYFMEWEIRGVHHTRNYSRLIPGSVLGDSLLAVLLGFYAVLGIEAKTVTFKASILALYYSSQCMFSSIKIF